MFDFFDLAATEALIQVILIDLVLAGDNAVVVALAAAAVPEHQRRTVIVAGIALAAVLRIAFALVTVQLLQITGLLVVGGLLLFWVGWRLVKELRHPTPIYDEDSEEAPPEVPSKTWGQAMVQILIADVSMSLDNVLGVAAVARDHPVILVIGLVLSVAFMGVAATVIMNLLQRYRWIAWAGVIIIFWVGAVMIYEGTLELLPLLNDSA